MWKEVSVMFENNYDYDVCLSFAGAQREYVSQVYDSLTKLGLEVFYDDALEVNLWGSNLIEVFFNTYKKKAKFCVMFISKEYKERAWTNFERQAALDRAFTSELPYILPVRFDDTEIVGVFSSAMYLDANIKSPEEIADIIKNKVNLSSPNVTIKDSPFELASYLIKCLNEISVEMKPSLKWKFNEDQLKIFPYLINNQKEDILGEVTIDSNSQIMFENINLVTDSTQQKFVDKNIFLQFIADNLIVN